MNYVDDFLEVDTDSKGVKLPKFEKYATIENSTDYLDQSPVKKGSPLELQKFKSIEGPQLDQSPAKLPNQVNKSGGNLMLA